MRNTRDLIVPNQVNCVIVKVCNGRYTFFRHFYNASWARQTIVGQRSFSLK